MLACNKRKALKIEEYSLACDISKVRAPRKQFFFPVITNNNPKTNYPIYTIYTIYTITIQLYFFVLDTFIYLSKWHQSLNLAGEPVKLRF